MRFGADPVVANVTEEYCPECRAAGAGPCSCGTPLSGMSSIYETLTDEQVEYCLGDTYQAQIEEVDRRMRAAFGGDEAVPLLPSVRFVYAAGAPLFAAIFKRVGECFPKADPFTRRNGAVAMLVSGIEASLEYDSMTPTEVKECQASSLADALMCEWAATAFPTVMAESKVMASVAATTGSQSATTRLPWRSMCVPVEPGILGGDAALIFAHELPCQPSDDDELGPPVLIRLWYNGIMQMEVKSCSHLAMLELEELVAVAEAENGIPPAEASLRRRILAAKIVGGLCCAMHCDNASVRNRQTVRGKPKMVVVKAPFKPGTYTVGLPIRCDLTQEVREWCTGTRKHMTRSAVRWLVRGHWRQQACGHDMHDHRRTWIAPYWKGPERAAALVRAHEIGSPGADEPPKPEATT